MDQNKTHIVLIGAGIMSATLGVLLRKLLPDAKITFYERLHQVAAESSDAWNNAGTGHAAYCELNYTPLDNDKVDISKALEISSSFEVSKELWSHLKASNYIAFDIPFIHHIPHMSFVWGEDNVVFLKKRYHAMQASPFFQDMLFSTDTKQIADWIPLMMEGRVNNAPLAATRMNVGTDVNFGAIARGMIDYLVHCGNVDVFLGHEVDKFTKLDDGRWKIGIENRATEEVTEVFADKVFIGAGGGSLPLLEKSGIEEAQGYGGFPVSGQFLRCTNEEVIAQHEAKVYGKAAVGSPPMSVPHLDTRMIDGKRTLFFGPYAGFTTRFLKNGSFMDLPLSIEMHNVWPILAAGMRNVELTKYLVKQIVQSDDDRFAELLVFYPKARSEDWELITAGQRVQIIKKDESDGGVLKFGTEIVCAADRSISALLGASPGASTSVTIMLEVLTRMFPDEMQSKAWQQTLQSMIPSFGRSLIDDGDLCLATRARTADILQLNRQRQY